MAGISPEKRTEVKDNLLRLLYGAIAILFAPIFVKLMLLINNNLVRMLVGQTHFGLDNLLGNSLLTSINTGNAIATSIVIALFAYLFVKINIKFIVRQFTLIVFTIFTPIVAVFWIINKRTIASSIWFGQIMINSFMQFIYAFLFLIYLTFMPVNGGWAVSLLWGMMILPLADSLQNTMQNLVSRIAGVNNDEVANRGIGMGAAMGYTVRSIAYQFKSNDNSSNASEPSVFSKIFHKTNNTTQSVPVNGVSYEENSTNIMDNSNSITKTANTFDNSISNNPVSSSNISNNNIQSSNNSNTNISNSHIQNNNEVSDEAKESGIKSGVKKAYNVGKEFMNLGMYMAEGRNFRTNSQNRENSNRRNYHRPNKDNTRKEDKQEENNETIIVKEDDFDEQ